MSKFDNQMYNKGYEDGFADGTNNPDEPNMREKVEDYIKELDQKIDKYTKFIENKFVELNVDAAKEVYILTPEYAQMESRIQTLTEVRNDLRSRLDELI